MKIILLIRSLEFGGAERQLLNLAAQLSKGHEVVILTFYGGDEYQFSNIVPHQYRVISLDKKGRWHIIGFITRFLKLVQNEKPDVIYAFMNTASVVSLLARLAAGPTGIVWGVRSSNMRLSLYGRLPRLFRWLECKLSTFADLVIANSEAGRREAISDGFKNANIMVIPNGIDIIEFRSSDASRREIRRSLNIPAESIVIGTVARHDPMKGLEIFLKAAAIHLATYSKTYFLIIGSGDEKYTAALKRQAQSLGLQDYTIWIRKTNHVASYYNAMDIFTSTSIYGEGFSNAMAEAMSCQRPCVVTDVGDSKKVVGDYGIVVPPDSPSSIAAAWGSLLKRSDPEIQKLGIQSREWISSRYSIGVMAASTEAALKSVRNGE